MRTAVPWEPCVPLSPFYARSALATFIAIGTGISTNLLVLQSPARPPANASPAVVRTIPGVDADNLGRKALDALIGSSLVAPLPENTKSSRTPRSRDTDAQRVGSFAPSSGSFAQIVIPGGDPAETRKATVKSVQAELARRGYEPGPPDGATGLVTRAAVMAYEHDQGLPLTADPSPEVLAHLRHGTSAPGAAIGLEPNAGRVAGHAEQVIKAVQQGLAKLGYLGSPPDGLASDETVRAIREFEMDGGLVPSGRISGPLMARLSQHISTAQRR
jgi:peptidoglycan hydrolase-like protein with peptidoglycan-binding domain